MVTISFHFPAVSDQNSTFDVIDWIQVEFDFVKILKKANSPFVLAISCVANDVRKTKLQVIQI